MKLLSWYSFYFCYNYCFFNCSQQYSFFSNFFTSFFFIQNFKSFIFYLNKLKMVKQRLMQPDVEQNGWLLDGYPRSLSQAMALENLEIRPDIFIFLEVWHPTIISTLLPYISLFFVLISYTSRVQVHVLAINGCAHAHKR